MPTSNGTHSSSGSLWKYNVIGQTVCLGCAGTLFLLRTYVRLGLGKVRRQWLLEDWMVCLSFLALAAYSGIMFRMMALKGGVHQWNLTAEQEHVISYWFWVDTVLYGIAILLTKISILLMYIRVFIPRRWSLLWTVIYSYMVICTLFYFSITIVKIWECSPRERIWNKSKPGNCINLGNLLGVSGVFNTVSDSLLLLIPVKSVWSLKLTVKRKIGVCLVFTIGAVAPIFAAIGCSVRIKTARKQDASHNQPLILLWATAEITTGVICACLPMVPSVFRRRDTRRRTATESSSTPSRTFSRRNEEANRKYMELEDYHTELKGLNSPDRVLITDISGGNGRRPTVTGVPGNSTDELIDEQRDVESQFGHGIVRTVEIESRVSPN